MPRSVTVAANHDHTMVGGKEHMSGDVVTVSNAEFAALQAAGAVGTEVTDNGPAPDASGDDSVFSQAALVAAPAALTSPASMGASYTKSEQDALRADVNALRTTVANMLTNMKGVGKPMSPT